MKVKEGSEKFGLKLNSQIDSQQEVAVWFRNLKQGLCINLEGWDGVEYGDSFKREGIYVCLWLIHVEV